jgi:hypothetical protein
LSINVAYKLEALWSNTHGIVCTEQGVVSGDVEFWIVDEDVTQMLDPVSKLSHVLHVSHLEKETGGLDTPVSGVPNHVSVVDGIAFGKLKTWKA